MRSFLTLLLLVALTSAGLQKVLHIGTKQTVVVTGHVQCMGQPMRGVLVKLYDHDYGNIDDLMGKTKTDSNGRFYIKAHDYEIATITPKLHIFHKCNQQALQVCDWRSTLWLPQTIVTVGNAPEKLHDVGNISLEVRYPGQKTDCLQMPW